jgi:subtilase family serine protease
MKKIYPISLAALAVAATMASSTLAETLPSNAALATPSKAVDFRVVLPLRNKNELQRLLAAQQTPGAPEYQKWLTPAQFAAKFGPTPQSIAKVQAALLAGGLQITGTSSRSLQVAGTVGRVNAVFGAQLRSVPLDGGHERIAANRELVLPTALQQEGAKIIGFANIPPHHTLSIKLDKVQPENRASAVGSYWFDDLKQAYDYPSYVPPAGVTQVLDGTGVHAAVLMSDLIYPNDVQALFDHENFTAITGAPAPVVNTVKIDGGGVYNGNGSFEASLDVQQITGGAPGAKVTLFSIPDLSDVHIYDGYVAIVESNKYDIVNSSFGGCELGYTAAYNNGVDYTYILQAEHEVFDQGNAQGITFVASSGDEGGLVCPSLNYFYGKPSKFVKSAGTPAVDPDVTAVGGGNLVTKSDGVTLDSTYVRESAFGDPRAPYDIYGFGTNVSGGYWAAGGGVSTIFAQPSYQAVVKTGTTKFRTIPDVGMQVGGLGFSYAGAFCEAITCSLDDSSVRTAFAVGLGGGFYRTIGTSVSSPEFVGAMALFIQKSGFRRGNINSYLYSLGAAQTKAGGVNAPAASQYYHRNIPGYDGVYKDTQPSQNYNYINGNGTPDVRKLFGLTGYAPAGLPQTPSNP